MVIVLCLAALVLILASLFDLFDRRSRSSGLICIALCLPLPAFLIYGEIQREKRQAVIKQWDSR